MFAVNIALDLLGAVIALIVFVSCLTEHIKKRAKSKTFLVILASTIVILVADAISGACIGSPQLATLTIIFKTAADCVACVVIVCIMRYLQETIFLKNRATKALLYIFVVLSAISVAASIANAYYGFAFSINGSGYVVNGPHLYITRLFSVIALVSIALSCLFVRGIKLHNRLFSLTYPLFPLVGAVIGSEWVFYTSAFIAVQTFLMWTHAKSLVQGEKDWSLKSVLLNPNIISICLSLVLFICRVKLPDIIATAASSMGNMIGPLCMFVIGMLIGEMNMKTLLSQKRAFLVLLGRLIVFPLVTVSIFCFSGLALLHPEAKQILFIVLLASCSPQASSVTQFAQIYDSEPGYSSIINVVTTLR